jgi:hypothetical protein
VSQTWTRHFTHVSAVACSERLKAYHNAFAAGQSHKQSNIYCNAPPPLLPNWAGMKKHPYSKEFKEAVHVEMNGLMEKETYKWVPAVSAA